MLLQQGQLHRQEPPLRRQPRQATAPVGVSVLQPPPIDDQGLGVPEHQILVGFGFQGHQHWSLRSVQVKLIKMGGRLVRHLPAIDLSVARGVGSSTVVPGSVGSYRPIIAGAKLREGTTTILPRGRAL